jgi:hypothetical protein
MGEDGKALTDFNHAITLDPNQASFYLGRGFLEHKQGEAVLAHEDIQRAQFANPLLPANIQFLSTDKNEDRYLTDTQLTDVNDTGATDSSEQPQN